MKKANNRIYHWYCYLNQKFEPIEGLTFTHIKYGRMTDQEKRYTRLLNDKKMSFDELRKTHKPIERKSKVLVEPLLEAPKKYIIFLETMNGKTREQHYWAHGSKDDLRADYGEQTEVWNRNASGLRVYSMGTEGNPVGFIPVTLNFDNL
jgi:hypothetical protein